MREQELLVLKERLAEITEMGWIKNQRPGNVGGVGNTLEDLFHVSENNLQLPDIGAWELKSQRATTGSLLTLFHCEPKPRNAGFVPRILLPLYGWPHQEAGTRYPSNERSFRQTITTAYSDRGFRVNVDHAKQIVCVSFDYAKIDDRHAAWRSFIREGVGTADLTPTPYWTFAEIEKKLRTKLKNLLYIKAETKHVGASEYFLYREFEAYMDPTIEQFLALLQAGAIYIDFDARTGHNHGTKFRIRPFEKTKLYQQHLKV
ncbi:MAG: MvaI/BcnI restriction endonuclease family protein [Anaerotruncus sp.]|nr:MvaI/BcnI restriction endonuclease family protein [Anaerotruncus sp.]